MIELKQHPELGKLIPPLSGGDFETLRDDIEAHGVRIPIIHNAQGVIIDG